MKKMTKKAAAARPAEAKKPAAPAVGKREQAGFRKQLLSMREDLNKTVEQKKQIDMSTVSQGDEADQATQSLEKEILFELSDNERGMLDQIEAALRKMEKGAYGFCESCRNPISLKRLQALPFARYCINCQGTMEHAAV